MMPRLFLLVVTVCCLAQNAAGEDAPETPPLIRDAYCQGTTPYTSQRGDTGRKIVEQVFNTGADWTEMWAWIVTCTPALLKLSAKQGNIVTRVPADTIINVPNISMSVQGMVTLHSRLMASVDLSNPQYNCGCTSAIHILQEISLLQVVTANYPDMPLANAIAELMRCNPQAQSTDGKVKGGQTLQGICPSLWEIPGKKWKEIRSAAFQGKSALGIKSLSDSPPSTPLALPADGTVAPSPSPPPVTLPPTPFDGNSSAWAEAGRKLLQSFRDDQCIPIFNYDQDDVVTIINNGVDCSSKYSTSTNKFDCSGGFWSAYLYNHAPACYQHDACLAFAHMVGWSVTEDSAYRCHADFRANMGRQCDRHHCAWWQVLVYECHMCHTTTSVWSDAVWNNQKGKAIREDGLKANGGIWRLFRRFNDRMIGRGGRGCDGNYCPLEADTLKYTPTFRREGGRIRSLMNGKCLDIPWGRFEVGNKVIMWDCNGGGNQAFWRHHDTDRHLRTHNNMCLDVFGGRTNNGAEVGLYTCSDVRNQEWVYDFDGRLQPVHAAGKCLDILYWDRNNGAKVVLWDCASFEQGGWNQKWGY